MTHEQTHRGSRNRNEEVIYMLKVYLFNLLNMYTAKHVRYYKESEIDFCFQETCLVEYPYLCSNLKTTVCITI